MWLPKVTWITPIVNIKWLQCSYDTTILTCNLKCTGLPVFRRSICSDALQSCTSNNDAAYADTDLFMDLGNIPSLFISILHMRLHPLYKSNLKVARLCFLNKRPRYSSEKRMTQDHTPTRKNDKRIENQIQILLKGRDCSRERCDCSCERARLVKLKSCDFRNKWSILWAYMSDRW